MRTTSSARPSAFALSLSLAVLLAPAGARAGADPHDVVAWSRAGGTAAVILWGVARWDYFERSAHTTREGWFGGGTQEGGADKAGHFYSAYVVAQGLGELYQGAGLPRDAAAREAALSSLLLLGVMELGDSFSPTYGFSVEDVALNVLGTAAEFWLHRSDAWRRRLDVRVEYAPSGDADPATDYENNKFLVALRLEGFDALAPTPLAWLELHGGFYARGYGSAAEPDARHLYAGIGLNLPRLLARAGWPKLGHPLRVWQPPNTVLAADRTLGG